MWKTIEKSDEHKVVVDAKKTFFLDEEIKQTPNFYSMGQNAVKSDFSKH